MVRRPDAVSEAGLAAARLDIERLRLVARGLLRTPLGVVPGTAFIAFIMAPHVGALRAWGWMAVVVAIWSVRAAVGFWLLRRPPSLQKVGFWIRWLIVSATVSGLAAGSSGLLFYGAPTLEVAFLTMILCAWCAAGLAVSGAIPAAFYGLVACFVTPLLPLWVAGGHPHGQLVAALLVFFAFALASYAHDNAKLVARALQVGFDNEELAQRLRVREAEAQAARERAEAANLSKSAFLAAASHDLRQPLHALSLLIYTLQEKTREPEAAELLKKIATSADSLDSLFKSLLDLSHLDAGSVRPEPRPVALGPLLARLDNDFRPLAQAKGLAFAGAASEAWVLSDPEMLERVLRNLLDNAVKYTQRGRIEIELTERGEELRLAVRDTGIGIDAAHLERIFEEYYQIRNPARDRRQGIGLGLAIVKRVCDLLGHGVTVESKQGQGTRFEVALPRSAPPAPAAAEARQPARSMEALHDLVVVVVEDDLEVQEAMRTLLTAWRCRPVICAGSEEALRQLDARALRPDAVLADYRLAGAESGLDVIARLCARYGDLPAAIVTGEVNAADLRMPEDLAVVVMQKPLRAADISDWLLLWKSIA